MNKFEALDRLKSLGIIDVLHTFYIQPVPAPRMTRSDKWKKRKCVTEYFAFRNLFMVQARKQGFKQLPEILNVCFILPMPESWSQKKKNANLFMPHRQRPDRDNLLKGIMDAFKVDDGYCWDGRTLKLWGYEPCIIIFK